MPRPLTRRRFIASTAGLCAAAAGTFGYARYLEAEWLALTLKSVELFEDKTSNPLKALHLSDFHLSPAVPERLIARALEMGLAQRPDLIFLTGDFVTGQPRNMDWFSTQLARLSAAAPTFACLGNHDGGRWARAGGGYPDMHPVSTLLRESGAILLRNQSCPIEAGGRQLLIAGVGDFWAEDLKPDKALTKRTDCSAATVILLSHNPDTKTHLHSYHWDLLLCGHTHGGQFRIPLLGTPFAPVLDHRYVEGLHWWQNRWIHITRGVGSLLGLRLNCRPEISVLEL